MASTDAMIHSYDVFDTIVVRACGEPHEVFTLLAYDILGSEAGESAIADFRAARIKGEDDARKEKGGEEVTIEDIYNHFPLRDFGIDNPGEVMRREMEIEREQIVAVEEIRKEIEELHAAGEPVYFISDMYLPDEWFLKMLKDKGFWQSGDKLYVSASRGATKRSGELYNIIANENKLNPKRWIHSGDNRHSDIRMARKSGIRTRRINHKYSRIERCSQGESFAGRKSGALLAATSKAVRLTGGDDAHYILAADLIAPLFTVFVADVMEDAQKRGIERVCFLARDGKIFYEIALALAPLYPNVKPEYLKVSRSSLYLPGIKEYTAEEIISLAQYDFKGGDVFAVLRNFVEPDTLHLIRAACPQPQGENAEKQLRNIISHPKAGKILKDYYLNSRKLLLAYLRQKGICKKGERAAIVDLRGSRASQKSINNILRAESLPEVRGYYFEVLKERKSIKEGGDFDAWIYDEQFPDQKGIGSITRMGDVLEEYFCVTDERRTIAYREEEGEIHPVAEREREEREEQERLNKQAFDEHLKACRRFAELFIKNRLHSDTARLKTLVLRRAGEFAETPEYKFLPEIRKFSQRSKPLVERIGVSALFGHKYAWRNGSIAFTLGPHLQWLLPPIKGTAEIIARRLRH